MRITIKKAKPWQTIKITKKDKPKQRKRLV